MFNHKNFVLLVGLYTYSLLSLHAGLINSAALGRVLITLLHVNTTTDCQNCLGFHCGGRLTDSHFCGNSTDR